MSSSGVTKIDYVDTATRFDLRNKLNYRANLPLGTLRIVLIFKFRDDYLFLFQIAMKCGSKSKCR